MRSVLFIILFFISAGAGNFDRAVSFVLDHEGGYCVTVHNKDTVEYNYGLSGKYYGDVKNLTRKKAVNIYARIWHESGADSLSVKDSNLALVFFDSYILFTPEKAWLILVACYDYRTYLIRRLQLHVDNIKKYKWLYKKEYVYAWMKRLSDLYDECQK
jgi:hypothetical protein